MATRNRKTSENLDVEKHRIRISAQVYDPVKHMYRGGADLSLRFSVASMPELRRLWAAIRQLCRDGAVEAVTNGEPRDSGRVDSDLPAAASS